ncbi:MAG: toll/interleukin-1 receptor domain-containing protein [Desulfarculus sp.]|nr:toll/interleukin-1 receptor domain-containing protein [Desulfarculus sp.]
MANPEHLAMLKRGATAWNQWREENPGVRPELNWVDLGGADLTGVALDGANLGGANLLGANLGEANLLRATLGEADLRWATLGGADLRWANLIEANLAGADMAKAILGHTSLGNLDLSQVKGLESVRHAGPSTIGIDTIYKSGGNIPEVFLRGCGVPEEFIEYIPSFVNKAIEYYSLFISYSSKDDGFARRLHADLQAQGVRCWFAPHDLRIGDPFRDRIDESIRVYDKLLIILSQNSIFSNWVEKEVETAFEKEQRKGKLVLFPIRLDEEVIATNKAWAADIRRARHIGDFTRWKEHDAYQAALARLLRDLKASAQAAG